MFSEDQFFERGQFYPGGFEEEQGFRAGLDFSVPPIMGFDPGEEVGAGDESGPQGRFGEGARRFQVRRGDKDGGKFFCRPHASAKRGEIADGTGERVFGGMDDQGIRRGTHAVGKHREGQGDDENRGADHGDQNTTGPYQGDIADDIE
jgi:hypothetical protein